MSSVDKWNINYLYLGYYYIILSEPLSSKLKFSLWANKW